MWFCGDVDVLNARTLSAAIPQADIREAEEQERERVESERQQQKHLATQRANAENATRKRLEKEARDAQKAQEKAEQDACAAAVTVFFLNPYHLGNFFSQVLLLWVTFFRMVTSSTVCSDRNDSQSTLVLQTRPLS